MSVRDDLLRGFATGNFLETVCTCSLTDDDNRSALASELAALHNEGLIDVVAAFEALEKRSPSGQDFFLTRRVFEESLPSINAPVLPVMQCILQLYQAAGQDLAASLIIDAFYTFCTKDPSRPCEALTAIIANPDQFVDLLPVTLIAGSYFDTEFYLAEAIRLCKDTNTELKRHAAFSLGRLKYPKEGITLLDSAFAALKCSAEIETDDQMLANILRSGFGLLQQDKTMEPRILTLISGVLSKGNEHTRHASSDLFGLNTSELSDPLTDILLIHLLHVEPTSKGTLNNVDYGISHLLKKVSPRKRSNS